MFKIKDKLRMRERKKERNDPLPHPSSLPFAVGADHGTVPVVVSHYHTSI